MRCKNCGWENMDGTARCEKCNSPLHLSPNDATQYGGYNELEGRGAGAVMTEAPDFGGTVTEAVGGVPVPPPYHGDMMSTVREGLHFGTPQAPCEPETGSATELIIDRQKDALEAMAAKVAANPSNCPSCGYPLSEGIPECPYCKTPISRNEAVDIPSIVPLEPAPMVEKEVVVEMDMTPPVTAEEPAPAVPEAPVVPVPQQVRAAMKTPNRTCPSCGATLTDNAKFCQSCGSQIWQAEASEPEIPPRINRVTMGTVRNVTVLPGMGNQEAPKPTVHYCTLRRREWPGEMVQYTPTTYSGDSIVLNRMNTDQHNNTITSKQQAVISCEDGQWYIEDRSALQSTYVRVKGKVPIKAGDIILLGNREFEFQGF